MLVEKASEYGGSKSYSILAFVQRQMNSLVKGLEPESCLQRDALFERNQQRYRNLMSIWTNIYFLHFYSTLTPKLRVVYAISSSFCPQLWGRCGWEIVSPKVKQKASWLSGDFNQDLPEPSQPPKSSPIPGSHISNSSNICFIISPTPCVWNLIHCT